MTDDNEWYLTGAYVSIKWESGDRSIVCVCVCEREREREREREWLSLDQASVEKHICFKNMFSKF